MVYSDGKTYESEKINSKRLKQQQKNVKNTMFWFTFYLVEYL